MATVDVEDIKDKLRCGNMSCTCYKGKNVHCPAHDDRTPSLSVTQVETHNLFHCHAGCSKESVLKALRDMDIYVGGSQYTSRKYDGNAVANIRDSSTGETKGLQLASYWLYSHLPMEFLIQCGLTEMSYLKKPAVRIPYKDTNGEITHTRYRISNTLDKFRWKSGDKNPPLYGLEMLNSYKDTDKPWVMLVEGETDTLTCRYAGLPALGIPGASTWNDDRHAQYLDGFDEIYLCVEPDTGGENLKDKIKESRIAPRVWTFTCGNRKDINELYVNTSVSTDDGMYGAKVVDFKDQLFRHLNNNQKLSDEIDQEHAEELKESYEDAQGLLTQKNILADVVDLVNELGLVGEDKLAQILYLAFTSRVLPRPVSVLAKGTSSVGKSFGVETVAKLFRERDDFLFLSGATPKALVNFENADFSHKMLYIAEWQGIKQDEVSYYVRTLMSEKQIRFFKSVKDEKENWVTKEQIIDGPTGVIVTTTAQNIHWENETRHLTLNSNDTDEQTSNVMNKIAEGFASTESSPDERLALRIEQHHKLQRYLAVSRPDVEIPYAPLVAKEIPPTAVRLRRDFTQVMNLISACAILHQENRDRKDGYIVASIDDYIMVRNLVDDLISEGVGRTVSKEVRDTVNAVEQALENSNNEYVTKHELSRYIKLSESALERRISSALSQGYLVNVEDRRGNARKLIIDKPLPEDTQFLPSPDRLGVYAPKTEIEILPPSQDTDDDDDLPF